ncbi:BCCT family transporter [Methanohalobium sp.]|uniref:BCCT family transporter n=1 Tax=Methanohalobium sp. TaxID=2837493 RepID=UPI00397DEFD5
MTNPNSQTVCIMERSVMMKMKVNPFVFFVSAAVIVMFVVLGSVFTEPMRQFFNILQDSIISYFGWFYILAVAFFLFFIIWLYFSPYGSIKLGKDDDIPVFSNTSWFAMLFSAGMGIGLLFYSVAEPVQHFSNPPGATAPESIEAARQAINLTFFHWGLHAWAIYIIVGLSLAYFGYRHDLPLSIRSTLYPLIGDRIYGVTGNIVEVMAIFGTVFGVATSLGLGVLQINSGLNYLGVLPESTFNQIILIIGITLAATISVVSGLTRGIRILSEMNLGFGFVLMMFVILIGPTIFLLSSFVQGTGDYLQNLISLTFNTDAYQGIEWQKSWTMFFWGWWISWSPFVGMFIARISRGRTIKEFISGVLIVPTVVTFIWIVAFGNTALYIELFGSGGLVQVVSESVPISLFALLENLPLTVLTSTLATIVVATFFITSADSGSLVVCILATGGDPEPSVYQRVFWAFSQGAVAAVLLLTGGLAALQTAAVTTALPFSIIMLFMCWSLVKGLKASETGSSLKSSVFKNNGWKETKPYKWYEYLKDQYLT